MFQTKEQGKLQKGFDEIDICNLPDKEFKVIVIKMTTELGRRIDGHRENFNKEMENIRKY